MRRDAQLRVEHGAHVAHGQFQLELTVLVGEVARAQVRNGDVVAIALRGTIASELHLKK